MICDPASLAEGEQASLGFECQNGPYVATTVDVDVDGSSSLKPSLVVMATALAGVYVVLGLGS